MRVEVSVDDGVLNWKYVSWGDEWKLSVPLSKMIPHPTFSIDRGARRKYLAITLVSPALVFGVMQWIAIGWVYSVTIPVVILSILGYRFLPWLVGPIEWASFDTMLKHKTVYVFRGGGDCGFDEFVAALDEAIVATHACSLIVAE